MSEPAETPLDLEACAREPIHLPGAIQPHGVLLVADRGALTVTHAAGDVAGKLGRGDWRGQRLGDLLGERLAARAVNVAGAAPSGGYAGRLEGPAGAFDVLAHVCADRLVVELDANPEPPSEAAAILARVEAAGSSFERAGSLPALFDRAAVEFRRLTGFDRVMVYRFLEDDAGAVVAEDRAEEMGSYLNHRFPGSDIPVQARALYVRNLVRVIPQADYAPAPLQPEWREAEPLDMSDCALRSVSPVHLQYLRNMEVAASASISIVKDGALWGLIACHHRTPKLMPYEVRAAARAMAAVLSRQIRAKEEAEGYRERLRLRGLEDEVAARFAPVGGLDASLSHAIGELGRMLDADGVAAVQGAELHLAGIHPPAEDVRALARWVIAHGAEPVVTDRLPTIYPEAARFQAEASGLLGLVVSSDEPLCLLWFRAEHVQVVEWGGNPHKAVALGPGETLTPRSSFAAWRETVRGRSRRWTLAEADAALRMRNVILDTRRRRRLQELNAQLSAALEEKDELIQRQELLLKEVNHRIQNSLQLVSSFLALQSRDAAEPALHAAFAEARRRLSAVALVHRRLYRADQIETVDLARYLEELIADMKSSMGEEWAGKITLEAAPILVPTDRAVTLGLVVTELIINANKYAYDGAPGPVEVCVDEDRDRLRVVVADHGRGRQGPSAGFGSRMISAMVRQLQGALAYEDNQPGVRAVLSAPVAPRG